MRLPQSSKQNVLQGSDAETFFQILMPTYFLHRLM